MRKNLALLLCFTFILTCLVLGCNNAAQRPDLPQDQQRTTDTADEEMTASERRVLASRLSNLAEQVEGVKKATVVVSSIGMTDSTDNNDGRNMGPGMNSDVNSAQRPGDGNRTTTDDQVVNNDGVNAVPKVQKGNNVSGLMVMVGLSLDENMNNADKASEIKRTVANKLKASDKRISQVLVTTDPGLVQRLSDVAAGIIQGRPIQGYKDDLNDLTRSMRQQQPAF